MQKLDLYEGMGVQKLGNFLKDKNIPDNQFFQEVRALLTYALPEKNQRKLSSCSGMLNKNGLRPSHFFFQK